MVEIDRDIVVSAVILAHNRAALMSDVLPRVAAAGVDEIVIVDSGSTDGTAEAITHVASTLPIPLTLLEPGRNVAIEGRNLAARAARGRYLLMVDDDSYPVPGAVESLCHVLDTHTRVAAVGGFVADVDDRGHRLRGTEVGTFDWFLRAGRRGDPPPMGFPSFFFPECACLLRRDAYLDVGGFREAFFFTVSEIDLTTRLIAAGWEVTYHPGASFEHLKSTTGRMNYGRTLRYRIRNQLWYFWLYFPASAAIPRMIAYSAFDLVECLFRRELGAFIGALRDAVTQSRVLSGQRQILPRDVRRRAELNRGRMHLSLLWHQLMSKVRGR